MTLGLDDKASREFARALAKMNGDMKRTQSGWEKFSKLSTGDKFSAAGKAMSSAGKSMTMGVTLPLAAVGAASVKAAMDFEQGMGNIATLVDTNRESMADMSSAVLAMGKRVPVSLSDLTGALYDVRSAGVSAADAMGVLETSAQLGVAGLGSTKEANDLLTSSLNAFGISAKEAGGAANTIFATVKSGKTTIAGLAEGFGATAPAVAAAGIKLDDYLSNVAALTAVGMPASQVHSQLKAVISGLTRETDKSRRVFGALGAKNLPDLIRKSGGLNQALASIRKELGGDSAKMLELVGSTEALNAMTALTTTQAGAQEQALATMRGESGLLAEAFDKQNNQMHAKMQRSKNALEAAAVSIGTKLMPTVERLADFVVRMADKWDALGPVAQDNILMVAGLLAVSGPLMTVIGGVSTAIGGIGTVASTSGAAITAAFGATSAAALALTGVIASLALVGVMLSKLSDISGDVGITGTIGKMWEMGTLDYFAANDAAMNETARQRYLDENGSAAAQALAPLGAHGAATGGKPVEVQNHLRIEVPPGATVTPVGAAPGTTVDVSRRGPVGG